ncbi:hypothetical protein J3Q64DRAFT_1701484 [Phycomyces blakesleeanus]|uniref:FHA domain-containing protein n=2 Tax=Phycomyces blakesleeanus TaxID=4837 RepID=A0A162NG38_PHYB8|nr:hypothetical protein PHYBLDRAFT_149627 [Phycomyces blakesleeanus NRRL 1555(-)]OAD69224.1 hypothetical protein PHYBLDRAFT_149627 [Phycomyces blakesleeanus NRRL 1555(-)]|eukprot:XP_018287264.1 hypothetical protein PHYBLDRAFT_149627 [Phycomyces blakesleeanus NRRL 1555(-)]
MYDIGLPPPLPPRPLHIPRELLAKHTRTIRIIPENHSSGSIDFEVIERCLVPGDTLTLGSITSCDSGYRDIVFDSGKVDTSHAMIWEDKGELYIRDLHSANGTYLNGVRLMPSYTVPGGYIIKSNDVIRLGRSVKDSRDGNHSIGLYLKENNIEANTGSQILKNSSTPSLGSCRVCHQLNEPLQALFVPSCVHILHFRCAELLLDNYPTFECPTCEKKYRISSTHPNGPKLQISQVAKDP